MSRRNRSPIRRQVPLLRFLPRDLTTILRRKMRRSYKRNQRTSLKILRKEDRAVRRAASSRSESVKNVEDPSPTRAKACIRL
jgi:hypothetical protein